MLYMPQKMCIQELFLNDNNHCAHIGRMPLQVLAALNGNTEEDVGSSLREGVDTMVDAIRAEVAAIDGIEADMAVEDAIHVGPSPSYNNIWL